MEFLSWLLWLVVIYAVLCSITSCLHMLNATLWRIGDSLRDLASYCAELKHESKRRNDILSDSDDFDDDDLWNRRN